MYANHYLTASGVVTGTKILDSSITRASAQVREAATEHSNLVVLAAAERVGDRARDAVHILEI